MENTNQEKQIKEVLRNSVSPFLIGLRNELKQTNSLVASLLEASQKEFENFNLADLKGDTGYTPKSGIDYFTDEDKESFLSQSTPRKGIDYFTQTEIKSIIKQSTPKRGVDYFTPADVKYLIKQSTPKKGVHYLTDKEIERMLKKITPKKGKDYADGKDGVTKTIVVKDETKIPAEKVRDLLESLKGSSRLSMKAIKGLEETIRRLEIAIANKAGGSSIGGTGGGGSAPDLSGYVPYIDATDDVNIGTHTYIGHAVRSDASDGLIIEAENGTDVGILGVGNTANVSWYGAHIFSQMTEGSVAFFGANGLLSQDNVSFNYISANDILNVFNTFTEKVSNGSFTGSASGWTLNTGWTYSSNAVHKSSNGTGVLTQTLSIFNGGYYKITYTISSLTVGTVTPVCGGQTLTTRSANGTYTEYFVATNNSSLTFTPTNTARFTIDSVSVVEMSSGAVRTGNLYSRELIIANNASNSTPGTTRHISLKNQGGATYIDAYFGNSLLHAIGMKSSGAFDLYTASGGSFNFYTNPTSPSQIGYFTASGLFSYYMVAGNGGVSAGNMSATQPATLTSWGSVGFKHVLLRENTTLTSAYTYVDADADSASSCSGTPTYSCSHWTTESDCGLRGNHGGCSWVGLTCSDYNGDQSSCEASAGCTWDVVNCSEGGAYDESSCTNLNSSYGGSCSWNVSYGDCGSFDESTCSMTSGCSVNYNYCSWDGMSCSGLEGVCDVIFDEGTCISTNIGFASCSGTYESGYSCDGTYNSGNCSGAGGSCTGTSSCSGITNSSNCGGEGGCTWTTGMQLTTPVDTGFSTNFMRTYYIRNIGSTGNVTVNPQSGQTINGTSSLVIGPGKSRHISYSYHQISCSTWNDTGETECESGHTGCEWQGCSGLSEEDCQNAGGQCTWNMEMSNCDGGGNCSGTWTVRRDWTVYGGVF